jgi:arylsulfatase
MLEFLESGTDQEPWFAYLPYTTPHWPLQVPEGELDRYAGQYGEGYDVLRSSRVNSANQLGVIPGGLNLDNFEPVAAPWEELSVEEQAKYSRAQEIYAAMVSNLDTNVGRLVSYLRDSGQLESTVIMFTSDHGASSGEFGQGPVGGVSANTPPGVGPQIPAFIDNSFGNWGRPNSFIDHGQGFAEAATAPLKGYKGRISEGGLRAAAFIHFPDLAVSGSIDGSFMTIMDVLPTFLDIAGTVHSGPGDYKGRKIGGIAGRSAWPYLNGETDTVHLPTDSAGWVQGELGALIKGNYKITNQRVPGVDGPLSWQLYDIMSDPGETQDLASQYPELVSELLTEWETNWR